MKTVRHPPRAEYPVHRSPPGAERGFDTDLAVDFLKTSGHHGRLTILRLLLGGEKSVSMLETLLGTRQASVSQQLARLRQEGLVTTRRDGKAIHYSLATPQVEHFVHCLVQVFTR